ncbi:hypothetical protein WJ0W_003601 [Paenibacillus melissococcoides]|uniref:Uncharacterized protein n=2 Tax=Paenibacillus TaxID=44249 RepID=A0ABM9G3V1_9BACL|nr:hypothetical protein WJ0W_003601 [Paenibacillus melissococcoides]CAH8714529.1 hypothetical protein HTL2_003973 [Paenibacillus melissococcoides]CAH8715485.1 hypothetical protein WDD9_004240 [Paenibacillus melissococcoides]
MVSTLKSEDSLLYLLMADKLSQTASLTLKVDQEGKREPEKYLAMDIQQVRRTMKVDVQSNWNIKVTLKVEFDPKVKVEIVNHGIMN